MNRFFLGSLVTIILLLALGYTFLIRSDDAVTMDSVPTVAPQASAQPQGVTPIVSTTGYLEHSSSLMAAAPTGRRVLFFYATWCPTCAVANKEFGERRTELPADLTLIRVNYNDPNTDDAEKALAQKYGVTYQHTFVEISADGSELQKWNGGGVDELITKLQ